MKRLIITADDFGLSPGVNDAVVAAHRAGTLTSASLMANMDGFQHAVDALAGVPGLDVGLHFVLAAGAPVSKPGDVPTMLMDGAAGRLVPPGDPAALADAIVDGEATDRLTATATASLGRYSEETMIEAMAGLYQRVLGGRKARGEQ